MRWICPKVIPLIPFYLTVPSPDSERRATKPEHAGSWDKVILCLVRLLLELMPYNFLLTGPILTKPERV